MSKEIVAIPSNGNGGLDGERAGHFGHCDVFTLFEIEGSNIVNIKTVKNGDHQEGGCLVPVNLLASHNVNTIIVGGMGMRPLLGFNNVGIEVYYEAETPEIKPVLEKYLKGDLQKMEPANACGGGNH